MNELDKIKSDMIYFGSGFALQTADGLKHVPLEDIYKMPNTTVTITYANGGTREFVASDELEKMIDEGEMFSVTTMHSDMSIDEEMSVSKMYVGNPIAAMGNMMMMKRNAEKLLESDESMNIVIETLNACIQFMSDEITSHQSGMTSADGAGVEVGCRIDIEESISDPDVRVHCPAIMAPCDHYIFQTDSNDEVAIDHCKHPENSKDGEGNTTSLLCPLCTEGGGS